MYNVNIMYTEVVLTISPVILVYMSPLIRRDSNQRVKLLHIFNFS